MMTRWQSHSNIVPYTGLGWTQSQGGSCVEVHLAQELVQGTDMGSLYLAQGIRMELDMLRALCEGVLSALAHLHSGDVVHRSNKTNFEYTK